MEARNNKGLIVLVVFLIVLVLGLAGYICYDKFFIKNVKPIPKQIQPKKTSDEVSNENDINKEIDSELQQDDSSVQNEEKECKSYINKELTYKVFNDTYYYSNICTKYIIKDLNIELEDKEIIEDGEETYIHEFNIVIGNNKLKDINQSIRTTLGKYKDYIVIIEAANASGIATTYIFDKNGNLVFNIPAGDEKGCQYILTQLDGEIEVKQDYGLDGYPFASSTCEVSNLSKPFSSYCSNSNNHLVIYKRLEIVNGKLQLIEHNYECDLTN